MLSICPFRIGIGNILSTSTQARNFAQFRVTKYWCRFSYVGLLSLISALLADIAGCNHLCALTANALFFRSMIYTFLV